MNMRIQILESTNLNRFDIWCYLDVYLGVVWTKPSPEPASPASAASNSSGRILKDAVICPETAG